MQSDAEIAKDLLALRIDAVEENDDAVVADAAGVADRLDEIDLALAVGGEVFDQQHPLAVLQLAFDLRAAAEALGLLADVLHRQTEPFGDPGGEGDAGGLAARHRIDLVAPDIAIDRVRPCSASAWCARRGNEISQRESL